MQKIILASANQGKIKEIKQFFQGYEVLAYSDIIDEFEIIEDGDTFAKNANIKAKAVFDALPKEYKHDIILSDDSGISVPILKGAPGIYSARYAGINANAKDNLNKLINTLNEKNITKTPAFYTAAITIINNSHSNCVHGWMYGSVINKALGSNGFGYDPMFVPNNHSKTLGELQNDIKQKLSHRTQALHLASYFIKVK